MSARRYDKVEYVGGAGKGTEGGDGVKMSARRKGGGKSAGGAQVTEGFKTIRAVMPNSPRRPEGERL